VTVEGTVTRAFGAYARIQDASGPTGASGLVVRQTAENDSLAQAFRSDISDGTITQGTRLQLTGTLSEFNGLLQVNNEDLDTYAVEGQGSLPAAQEVTFSDLSDNGENYESELIRVETVLFEDPSATGGTLDAQTSYDVEDGDGTTFTYRVQTNNETEVIGTGIPNGTFTYEGVVGEFDGQYQLIPVRSSSGLPVEMAGFEATRSGSSVELRWSTASETNNAGFRVQHEPVGQDSWQEVGFVESQAKGGTTTEAQTYRYSVQQELEPGTHRFRLQQQDLDGSTSLSDVVSVEVQMRDALTLRAPAPNPTTGQATVTFAVKEATDAEVVLYDMLGQQVRTLYEGTPAAGQAKALRVRASDLPSGTYMVQLRADGQTRTQRLIVVR
jgi:DNA/RNA endonuclease YhcR with UshA esterase domain